MLFLFKKENRMFVIDSYDRKEANELASKMFLNKRGKKISFKDLFLIEDIIKYNNQIVVFNASFNDELKRGNSLLTFIRCGGNIQYSCYEILNLGQTEYEENQIRYLKDNYGFFTGSHKCCKHTNDLNVWFDL